MYIIQSVWRNGFSEPATRELIIISSLFALLLLYIIPLKQSVEKNETEIEIYKVVKEIF